MEYCNWLISCIESSDKGGGSFVQVCLGFNLAHATWTNYRNQYRELVNKQKEVSSDVSSDLIETLKDANRITKAVFYIYIFFTKTIDYLQSLVYIVIYILTLAAIAFSLCMLYFNTYTKFNVLLLVPPIALPMLYIFIRYCLAWFGKAIQWLLKMPTGQELKPKL